MKGVKEGGDGGGGGGGKVVAGPALFPRLHVAETKKAGPRGPPRNKMALYEQLTIPSHRFKPTPVPLPASSGRAMTTPIYQPQVQVQSPASSFDSRYSYMPVSYMSPIIPTMAYMPMMNVGMYGVGGGSGGGASATSSMNGSSARSTVFDVATESQRVPRGEEAVSRRQTSSGHSKPQGKDEDDFAVPTYSATQASSQTRAQASRGGHHRVTESAIAKRCSIRKERSMEDDASWTSASVAVSVVDDDVITKGRRDCEELSVNHHIAQERKEKGLSNHSNTTGSPEVIDSLRPVPEQDHQSGEASEPSQPRGGSSTETELSMMENITSSSICFRDVVDAFGQQEFWKAQSTIIRQQKLFARQVFELHRVVEVQHLLAKKSSLSLNIDEVLEEEADNVPVPASPVAAVSVVPEIPETDGSQSSEENSRPVPEAVCQPIYPLSIPTQQDYNSASAWQQAAPFGANQWAARMASPFMYVPYQGSCPPGYGVYPTMGGPMPMYGGAGGMQAARFPAWQQQPGMSQPWGMQESAAAAAAAAGGWYGQQPVVPTVVPSASERLAPSAVNQAVSQHSEGSSREKGDRSSKADGVKSFGWAKGWGSTEERVVVRGESEASKSKESVAAAPSVAYELGRREGDAIAGKQMLNADANEVRGRDLESEPRAWPSGASYEGPLHNRTLKRPRADVPDVAVSPWFRVVSPSNRISQQQNGVIKVVPRAVSATPESAASILLSIQKERQR